eukprot:5444874-Pyramimonas_sp.AAC.1
MLELGARSEGPRSHVVTDRAVTSDSPTTSPRCPPPRKSLDLRGPWSPGDVVGERHASQDRAAVPDPH